jgi:hypothetical protein
MHLGRAVLAVVVVAASPVALSAPCAGFADVDDTSSFCANVQWVKNRSITLGCTSPSLYCPNDPVSRLAMAAFMNRLGDALAPVYVHAANINAFQTVNDQGVACETQAFSTGAYQRVATPVGAMLYHGGPGVNDVATRLVYRLPPSTTWFEWGSSVARASSTSGQVVTQTPTAGPLVLQLGQAYAFGIDVIGTGPLAVSLAACELVVRIEGRPG